MAEKKVRELTDDELEEATGGEGTPYIVEYCPDCGYEFSRRLAKSESQGPGGVKPGRSCPQCRNAVSP